MTGALQRVGALRIVLFVLALLTLAFLPTPGTPPGHSGWALVTTVIAPSIVPMFIAGLAFDLLMAPIMLKGGEGPTPRDLRLIVSGDIVALAALLIGWGPVFVAMIS